MATKKTRPRVTISTGPTITLRTPKSVQQAPAGNLDDHAYAEYLHRMRSRIEPVIEKARLFVMDLDAEALWSAYLLAFPKRSRQYHTCNACREFIRKFGNLATITDSGGIEPVMWNLDDNPPDKHTRAAATSLRNLVAQAGVRGVFYHDELRWGTPVTGCWRHFGKVNRGGSWFVTKNNVQTPHQKMAEKQEDYRNVQRVLRDFTLENFMLAIRLLSEDVLYRGEKVLGGAEWLRDLAQKRRQKRGQHVFNHQLWAAVAEAPAGFCHPKSGMLGSLLEDIQQGKSIEECRRAFNAKMNPTLYQRPQAAPKQATIAQANTLVEKLQSAGAFRRRFCLVSEVVALWRPTPPRRQPTRGSGIGLFSDVKPRPATGHNLPALTLTCRKFVTEYLPKMAEIKLAPLGSGLRNFGQFLTATVPGAPPIFQWDHEHMRNPVSWYVYHQGSTPIHFGVSTISAPRVAAITESPAHWYGNVQPNQPEALWLLLDGAYDRRKPGLAIFPETLRSEYHGVRSVIEGFSSSGRLDPIPTVGGTAAGLCLGAGAGPWKQSVQLETVDMDGFTRTFILDRFD